MNWIRDNSCYINCYLIHNMQRFLLQQMYVLIAMAVKTFKWTTFILKLVDEGSKNIKSINFLTHEIMTQSLKLF